MAIRLFSPTSPPVLLRHETQREVVIESLKADCEVRTGRPPGKYAGREGLKRSVAKQRASSSDLHISIEEQIAQGDKVVTWVIGSGTHNRELYGFGLYRSSYDDEAHLHQPRARQQDR
jgi:hypothetical protein